MSTQNITTKKPTIKSCSNINYNDDETLSKCTLVDKLIKSGEVSLKCCKCSKLFNCIYHTYITAFNPKCGNENYFHLLCNSCKWEINKKQK